MPHIDSSHSNQFLQHLCALLGPDRYEVWCEGRIRVQWKNGELRLGMVNQFVCDHLRSSFHNLVAEACRSSFGEPKAIHYSVATQAQIDAVEEQLPAAKKGPKRVRPSRMAPPVQKQVAPDRPDGVRTRFALLEEFEAGSENRLALEMCRMLVAHGDRCRSLVLHGGPATGKTHLLQGLWRAFQERKQQQKVALFTAEEFTQQFVSAHRQGGLPVFCGKLRTLDVLLIDDFHELADRRASREELQQTVELLMRGGRQVVLASAKPLSQLSWLEEQFASRMTAGHQCALVSAELATRRKLCERYALREGVDLDADAMDALAECLPGDVRALSGAMLRLKAMCQSGQVVRTKEEVLAVFQDGLLESPRQSSMEAIIRVVCDEMGVTDRQIKSPVKQSLVSTARMIGMFLARRRTSRSLAEIGQTFGGRKHSTVASAQVKVKEWIDARKELPCGDLRIRADELLGCMEAKLKRLG